ncbi:uncharacterized protein PHALS_14810 [Plasmopara halstedii]|uniref:Uncharacterized protein n=1 Tax=Plasmopara halstedii TaxID=4781 RepID=A0A0P1ATC7_PLAHL|nr:uncharacterized protein PHALS_14810 [Plasmopara halstedii]CEG45418.1 hypothetical protein PHALS_14810 [Plasmopara halstedii]|eukprot:XP_024581787.1 hypothetical protein PHALS_14810 [Plasmopara halstedii]
MPLVESFVDRIKLVAGAAPSTRHATQKFSRYDRRHSNILIAQSSHRLIKTKATLIALNTIHELRAVIFQTLDKKCAEIRIAHTL